MPKPVTATTYVDPSFPPLVRRLLADGPRSMKCHSYKELLTIRAKLYTAAAQMRLTNQLPDSARLTTSYNKETLILTAGPSNENEDYTERFYTDEQPIVDPEAALAAALHGLAAAAQVSSTPSDNFGVPYQKQVK